MQPLDKTLRNQLDRTIRKARPVAEQAAEAALEQLGVGEESPPSYLGEDQRGLRRRLRAHARSLGDPLKDGAQAVTRLIGEIAYEHWHRMLFARFLAENDLLMYDGVAVTLEECEELAEEEGQPSGWALAAGLASTMLPQVFRVDSPVFELTLAAEYQRDLEGLLIDLPLEVFQASDSLGWVYQFWQTDNKERINRSEVKIGADELPAVTQLFTEPYMVNFLLDNSLGAWWAARRLSETDLASAESEQALRDKASLPGVPLEYLRFVKDEETGNWTPAAGTFEAWPQSLAELKTLDPCCGSGHFLVAALLMLVPMRMELEGLSAREAVDAVLRDNLHGLEIDQRCVELAAFALALTAWRYPGTGGYRKLPELHLACSGLAINAKKSEWLDLAGNDTNLGIALEKLYKQFKDAPILGSLINPEASLGNETLFKQKWEEVGPIISKVLADERDEERSEVGVVAKGVAKSAVLLSQKYDLALTNVPYLGVSKHHPRLIEFIEKHYSTGKYDLAMAFIERIREWIKPNGSYAVVSLGEWLYLGPYMQYRENYLEKHKPLLVLRLGWNAFSTPIRANPALIISQAGNEKESSFSLSDYSANKKIQDNVRSTVSGSISQVDIAQIRKNPDMRFINPESSERDLLVKFADARSGLHAGDLYQFFKMFWEVENLSWIWEPVQTAVNETANFSGKEQIIRWENENGSLAALAESVKHLNHAAQNWRAGKPFWGKHGIVVGLMGKAACAIYSGQRYDVNSSAVIPKNKSNLPALWVFCESGDFSKQVRLLDNSLKLAPKTLLKVSFDLDHWTKVAEQKYPHGLPEPYTDDPTQWIFHGHPCGSVIWDEKAKWTAQGPLRTDDTVLQVAVARLLGYRWPAELDPEMELAEEQREWVNRCEALLSHADRDGIVCLPAVRGERRAVDRLETLLADAYGDQWSATTRSKLLESVDHAGKDLESWLRDKFFAQHCKLFQNRPFIWHIWDGLKDGFSALVNYHKLDYKALETLTYTYLGDWITQQKKQIGEGIDGAEARLAAAEALQKSLELILEGEEPYDIFVRWKPLEEQPIGWHPDLNDGVRLNIRPFMSVPDVKKKGAGVLVHKPNIHWKKDRGKDVESAPWYNLGPQLGGAKGDRINDYHLTLASKKAASKQAEGK
ncbi:Eco57I restriction-modification methylase domain-containing protein [Halomonas sp. SL1]|uniref:Eco57I restriction-modification methylase domain-containing protein n=1 Tax=Halomonas sp. SL1 TaxID=2137478 RepID=UPI000D1574A9|nr:DNA methyltransferase [Halomonas sp. SL1]RAH37785.1 SAM-dependent DNA methyltransferase [Halomonas sp. SL1]